MPVRPLTHARLLPADNAYRGELAQPGLVAASGVEFWMEGTTIRRAIALLKQRNPYTKVCSTGV